MRFRVRQKRDPEGSPAPSPGWSPAASPNESPAVSRRGSLGSEEAGNGWDRWAGMAPVQDPAKANQAIRQSTTGLGIRRYLRDPQRDGHSGCIPSSLVHMSDMSCSRSLVRSSFLARRRESLARVNLCKQLWKSLAF